MKKDILDKYLIEQTDDMTKSMNNVLKKYGNKIRSVDKSFEYIFFITKPIFGDEWDDMKVIDEIEHTIKKQLKNENLMFTFDGSKIIVKG